MSFSLPELQQLRLVEKVNFLPLDFLLLRLLHDDLHPVLDKIVLLLFHMLLALLVLGPLARVLARLREPLRLW